MSEESPKGKKWYKKWWGILLILYFFAMAANFANYKKTAETKENKPAVENKKTDSEHLAEIEGRIKQIGVQIKTHYPDDDDNETLSNDVIKLVALEAAYKKSDDEKQRQVYTKANQLLDKLEPLRKEVYAKSLEHAMMKKGFNATISAIGSGKNILSYKYALLNKPAVYQLTNETQILASAKKIGFTKVVFKGAMDTWTYDLKKL